MGGNFQQFKALMVKNILLKRRKLVSTLLSVILPALIMLLLVWLHTYTEPEVHEAAHHLDDTCHLSVDGTTTDLNGRLAITDSFLAFAPSSAFTAVIERLTNPQAATPLAAKFVRGFDTIKDLDTYLKSSEYGTAGFRNVFAAVTAPTGKLVGPDYAYTLRFNVTSGAYEGSPNTDTTSPFNDVTPKYDSKSLKTYCKSAYAGLQLTIDMAILAETGAYPHDALQREPAIEVVPMPTRKYTADIFSDIIGSYMGFFFTILGVLPITLVVGELVSEKELRIREGTRMMGLKTWVISLTWWLTYAALFAVTCLLMILTTTWSIYQYSNTLIIFIFFYAYYMALYAFAFFMSTFFSRAQTAASFSAIIFIVSLFLGDMAAASSSARSAKLLGSFAPSIALAYGSRSVARLESGSVGVTWSTLDTEIENYSVADSIMMLILTSVIMLVLGLYLQEVLPNEYGTPRKWYFFLKPSFWCGSKAPKARSAVDESVRSSLLSPNGNNSSSLDVGQRGDDGTGTGLTIFDNEPYSKIEAPDAFVRGKELVRIRGLRKTFPLQGVPDGEFVAVNALSLDMYEGQIFTLLGHNGAGKSTMLNALTGLYPMTSGHVTVLGRDLAAEMDQIRMQMGVCPQHDILYSHLSVREHLELYAAIKGVPEAEVAAAAQRMIDEVGLGATGDNKANALAGTLSGGQKRKLSVGIALIGDSKIVYLDEPSSGMDVASQRVIWDLLLRSKAGRVIVLTTHSMEEAEIGDRIAIMASGKLMCNGSSLFLKHQYGAGYTLTVSKAKTNAPAGALASSAKGNTPKTAAPLLSAAQAAAAIAPASPTTDAEVDVLVDRALSTAASSGISPVRALVLAVIPAAEVLSDAGGEISFRLPFSAAPVFPLLFDALEQRKLALGVAAAGMSVTTLTEVFLRVGHGADHLESEGTPTSFPAGSHTTDSKVPVAGGINSSAGAQKPVSANTSASAGDAVLSSGDDAADYEAMASAEGEANVRTLSPSAVFIRHTKALIARRFHTAKRDRRVWTWQLLFPMLVLTAFIVSTRLAVHAGFQAVVTTLPAIPNPYTFTYINTTTTEGTTSADALSRLVSAFEAQDDRLVLEPLNDIPAEDPAKYKWSQLVSDALMAKIDGDGDDDDDDKKNTDIRTRTTAGLRSADVVPVEVSVADADTMESVSVVERVRKFMSGFTAALMGGADDKEVDPTRFFAFGFRLLRNFPDAAAVAAVSESETVAEVARDVAVGDAADDTYINSLVFINTTARDAMPMAVNAWTNALLRATHASAVAAGDADVNAAVPTVTVTNKPLDKTHSQMVLMTSGVAFAICMAMAFVPATFAGFLVKERADKGKHLQLISGVSALAYWVSALIWDLVNFILPFALVIIVLLIFDVGPLLGDAIGATMLSLWLFCLAVAPFTYCLTFLFESHSVAQNVTLLANFFFSVLLLIAYIVMAFLPSTADLNSQLAFLYRFFPPFCLGELMANLMVRDSRATFGKVVEIWDLEVTGWPFIFLVIDFFVYAAALLVIEHVHSSGSIKAALASLPCRKRRNAGGNDSDYAELSETMAAVDVSVSGEPEDDDVAAERARVASGECDDPERFMVAIKGLRKVYPSRLGAKPHIAVANMAYSVGKGECFGFLGANGAGKTTTLKMMTGDESPTSGTALLGGLDIMNNPYEVRQLIGYCPQFDALLPLLTAREHLMLYARIKCVPEARVERFVAALISKLGLEQIADKPAGTYSGGNKRKLSVGIALVGNPLIVFLDEPSTGMDPQARRSMWKLISSTMANRSVILTTHSMEECEALCDRIGIMTGGRLRCLGTAPHLKQRFGSGYQVVGKTRAGAEDSALDWIKATYPNTTVIESHGQTFKVRIDKAVAGPTSAVFRAFESNKARVGLDSYSVSDTDLEQIFIQMVRAQEQRDLVERA